MIENLNVNSLEDKALYYSVSSSKLSRLYILTLGFYGIYWFYANWKKQKEIKGMDVMPIPRSIFSVFYTHSLFRCISDSLKEGGIASTFQPKLMATIFVALLILGNLISNIGELPGVPDFLQVAWLATLVLSVFPLQEAQDAINLINKDPLGLGNSKYSWQNILVLITGGFFWMVVVLGIFVGSPS